MVNKAVNFMTICLHFISGSIFCDSSHQAQSAARRLLHIATALTLSYSSVANLISCQKNPMIKKVLQNALHFGLTPCKTEEKTGNILLKNFQSDRCYTKIEERENQGKTLHIFCGGIAGFAFSLFLHCFRFLSCVASKWSAESSV